MASLKEIAYNIKSIANNGNPSDDDNLSLRQVYNWIHTHRAAILKEYSKNGEKISPSYYQTIEIVGAATTSKLPFDLIYLDKFNSIERVHTYHSTGALIKLNKTTKGAFKSYSSNKFTGSKPYYYIHKGGNESIPFNIQSYNMNITVGGPLGTYDGLRMECILSNPEQGFNETENGGRFNYDAEYPFPQELVSLLIKSVVETELHISMSTQEDKINDGDDATLMRSKRAE